MIVQVFDGEFEEMNGRIGYGEDEIDKELEIKKEFDEWQSKSEKDLIKEDFKKIKKKIEKRYR